MMSKLKSTLKATLSRLRMYVLSRDLQDIYRFDSALDLTLKDHTKIDFKVFDTAQVFDPIHTILPMSAYDRNIALSRIKAGDKAVIGFDKETPVFYGWLMFDEMEMTYGVYVPVAAGTTFAYNLFTKASFRRQGALTQFYHFTHTYLNTQNRHALYCGIATQNHPSIKGHLKNGFRKTGFFYSLKILGISFTIADAKYPKRLSINRTKYSL